MNVHEHGIVVDDELAVPGLRVLATNSLPLYFGYKMTILDLEGGSLNARAVSLASVTKAHSAAHYFEESDLRYCVQATLYHLHNLLDRYVGVTTLFEELHPQEPFYGGNTWEPRVYFELDAFLTAARRAYEAVKKVMWKHFCNGNRDRWTSIREALDDPRIPEHFRGPLKRHWQEFGDKLAAYRNCVAHYDPLNPGTLSCSVKNVGGRRGVLIKLPANPKSKSRRDFDFDNGPEALSYCHAVACELVGLCEVLCSIEQVRVHLDNPPVKQGS